MQYVDQRTPLQKIQGRHTGLIEVRNSWQPDWLKMAQLFLPRKCRFLETASSTTDKGGLRSDLLDNVGVYAMRTLAAGLQGGMTSPARPWLRLTLDDPDRVKAKATKEWLDIVQGRLYALLSRSNFYTSIHSLYSELGTFGTGCMFQMPDPRYGFRFRILTAGEYCLDMDVTGKADTLYRIIDMPARHMVNEFGYDQCSEPVKQAVSTGNALQIFKVVHAVLPRADRDFKKLDAKNKAWASVWYEFSGTTDRPSRNQKFLKESGFDEFPAVGPRWDVTGDDVYGRSPAMDCFGDTSMTLSMKRSLIKMVHKLGDPPTVGPSELKHINLLPGGQNFVDSSQSGQAVYPAQTIQPAGITATRELIREAKEDIRHGLYNDLFLMLAQSDRRNMTATEVAERHEEKLIMLGPVLERLHDELLNPIVDRSFNIMVEMNMVPPPPPEIQGLPLRVEFISLLAQAQKMIGTNAIDQHMSFVMGLGQAYPEILDTINPDRLADTYGDYLGVEEKIKTSGDERKAIREQRNAEVAAQQQMGQVGAMADMAQKASQTPLAGGTALDALMGGIAGGVQ